MAETKLVLRPTEVVTGCEFLDPKTLLAIARALTASRQVGVAALVPTAEAEPEVPAAEPELLTEPMLEQPLPTRPQGTERKIINPLQVISDMFTASPAEKQTQILRSFMLGARPEVRRQMLRELVETDGQERQTGQQEKRVEVDPDGYVLVGDGLKTFAPGVLGAEKFVEIETLPNEREPGGECRVRITPRLGSLDQTREYHVASWIGRRWLVLRRYLQDSESADARKSARVLEEYNREIEQLPLMP